MPGKPDGIVAPKVVGHQLARFFVGVWNLPGRLLGFGKGRKTKAAAAAPALAVPVAPANDEDAARHAAE